MVTKEEYIKAIKGDLSFEDLCKVASTKCPQGIYYDYDSIKGVLLRKLNNEITDRYFRTWLIIVCWVLSAEDDEKHGELSWEFDGASFSDSFSRNDIIGLIKILEDHNYRLFHKDYIYGHKKYGSTVCYILFDDDSKVFSYLCYIVDHKNKKYTRKVINYNEDKDEGIKFSLDKFYCFLEDRRGDDFDEFGHRKVRVGLRRLKHLLKLIEDYTFVDDNSLIGFVEGESFYEK